MKEKSSKAIRIFLHKIVFIPMTQNIPNTTSYLSHQTHDWDEQVASWRQATALWSQRWAHPPAAHLAHYEWAWGWGRSGCCWKLAYRIMKAAISKTPKMSHAYKQKTDHPKIKSFSTKLVIVIPMRSINNANK